MLARRNSIVYSRIPVDDVYTARTSAEPGDQARTEANREVTPGYFQHASDEMLIAVVAVVLDAIDAYETPARNVVVGVASGATTRGALLAQPVFAPLLERQPGGR